MEKKNNNVRVGCTRFFWAVLVIVLCATPVVWADIDIIEDVQGDLTVASGTTVNLYANVSGSVWVYPDSHLNIYSGNVSGFFGITVLTGAIDAVVTVYGTDFADSSGPISTTEWTPSGGSDTLTGTYENGDPISLLFYSDTPINLQTPAPDDPIELIQELIDTVTSMNLQQGIDNSLDAKLDAALNALDDVNTNNDVAAINTLQAFISAVEAQRDNKITSEQADTLVADAQAIIDLLST